MLNNQSGRSMIEMLGVLAIIGVLSAGGLTGYAKAMRQYRINKTVTQVTDIVSRMAMLGDQLPSYTGLSNETAIKMGVVPSEMISSNTELENVYHGSVTIRNSNLTAEDSDMAYIIQYQGLPKDACMTLATQNWQGNKDNMVGVGIGSDNSKLSDMITTQLVLNCSGHDASGEIVACRKGAVSLPMDMGKALKGCSCTGNTCVFVLKSY